MPVADEAKRFLRGEKTVSREIAGEKKRAGLFPKFFGSEGE